MNQMSNQSTRMTNQTAAAGTVNQTGVSANAVPQAATGQNQLANNQFSQIIHQVAALKQALHDFVDQEDFPDAAIVSASGVLEHHLDHYQQLALQKENQKPGLETF